MLKTISTCLHSRAKHDNQMLLKKQVKQLAEMQLEKQLEKEPEEDLEKPAKI